MPEQDLDTRQKILNAARELFSKRGFEGASIRDIAALAGINKSLVHYHFKSKSDILSEIAHSFVDEAMQEMGDFGDLAGSDSPTALQDFLKVRMDFLLENKDFLNILIIEALKADPEHHFIFSLIRSLVNTIIGKNPAMKVEDYQQFVTRFFFFTLTPMLIFSVIGKKMSQNLDMDFEEMKRQFNENMIRAVMQRMTDDMEGLI